MITQDVDSAYRHNLADVLADAIAPGATADAVGVGGGIPTGFHDLDALTGGLRHGYLTVIAGQPNHGASTLALSIARASSIGTGPAAAATPSWETCIIALEATAEATARRIFSAKSRIALHHITGGFYTEDDVSRFGKTFEGILGGKAELRIDDTHRSLPAIETVLAAFGGHPTRALTGPGPDLLIVDGAHLITPDHEYGGRAQHADDVARTLKEWAVTRAMHVIATVPLELREPRPVYDRPKLTDFGKRQAFVQAADMVILVHREDEYERESPRAGEIDLIIAKHRNGPPATLTAAFQGHYARVVELAAR